MASARAPLKLAVAGLGAIGLAVARRVDAGELPGMLLIAAAARDHDKARKATAGFRAPPPMTTLAGLAEVADVILECLPAAQADYQEATTTARRCSRAGSASRTRPSA